MERYVFGKEISRMLLLLGSGLTVCIKLEEVHWEPCLATHLYNLNYGTGGSPIFHYKALPDVRQMVIGMPEFKVEHEGVCPRCAKGKLTRGPFPSSNSKTTDILQLIYSNISSMILVYSLGGYLYYLTFVNDYSRKT